MNMPPDMVIFDCDGVLVDSEGITNRVIQSNFAKHGLSLELDEIMRLFVGGTMQGVMDLAREMGAALPDDWLDIIYPEMYEALGREVEAIPGAMAVLDALDAAGIPYAVGSNGPHAKMDVTLKRTGLDARLSGRTYSRQDVKNPKPAPDVYLMAANIAGIDPSRCVVVEDSASGAKAGGAAGMFTSLFSDMSELPKLLGL